MTASNAGNLFKQSFCIGMNRIGKLCFRWGHFNNTTKIHDGDLVTQMADHAEIMTYEQKGQRTFFFQIQQQIDDLGLD